MRKPIIAGNWKLNKNISEAVELTRGIKENIDATQIDVIVCPVFTVLSEVSKEVENSSIMLGAQDVFWEKQGAYTGEVSSEMLKDAGCDYVIIGHSERRQYFGETNETVNKKIKASFDANLKVMMCVGETLEERESDKTFQVVENHIFEGLKGIELENIHESLVIAYEPVWAIGTGKTATPQQASEVHLFIREKLSEIYGSNISDLIRIQYGGSVKPDNIEELLNVEDIDGALVGGASLKIDSFCEIANISNKVYNKLTN